MNMTEKYAGRKNGRHMQNTHSVVTPSDPTFLCGRVLTLCLLVRTNRRAAIRQVMQTGSTFWLLESRCDRYKFGEVVVATALKVVVEP